MTKEELRKEATMTVEWECTPMIERPIFINGYITSAEPREKRIAELEKENAELKEKLKPENCLKLLAKEGYVKFTSDNINKAKEILEKLLEEEKNNTYWKMNGSDKSSYYEVRKQAEQFLKEQTINKSGIKKLKYYKNYPVESQKKFLDLIASGIDYEEALKESQLDKECLEDWIYEDNKVVDSDVKKGWEDIEGELCINGEYHVNICYVNAACYDYDPFKELYIAVEKIDKEAEFKNCLNWIEEQKKKFENDFEKFAEFVYTEYNVKGSK